MVRGPAVGLALALTLGLAVPALANPTWSNGPASFVESTAAPPADPAPNQPAWPVRARLSQPADNYDHDILGGIPHFTVLDVETLACSACNPSREVHRIVLPGDLVFEDVASRLWDVTGDHRPEVVVVEADPRQGARLAVWGFAAPQGALVRLAATPFIGTPRRWLAPVGAGDFDGDGQIELAYVDRPHLAQQLVFVRLSGAHLREIARTPGFTAHRIGDTTITAHVRICQDEQAELLLPDGGWTRLLAVRISGGTLKVSDLGALSKERLERAISGPCG